MNKVFLIGNLTRDPESNTTASGIQMCRFSIAVNRRFKNSEGEVETDFFNITSWRNNAEYCGKYLRKGIKVAVIGSLQNRSYDAEDGSKRYVTDVIAEEVEILTPKGSTSDASDDGTLKPIEDDGLPF
jgi:single-strand DNA-binding protein